MPLTVEAVYENGVLKPAQPLPLKEHERVQITIAPKSNWVQPNVDVNSVLKWGQKRATARAMPRWLDRGIGPCGKVEVIERWR